MKKIVILAIGLLGLGCSKSGGTLTPSEVGNNGAKYSGQKVTVSGVYTQGFSKGGKATDPWALVVGDNPSAKPTISCVVPAKVDLGTKYPKITATGVVSVESGNRVFLNGCTYNVEK